MTNESQLQYATKLTEDVASTKNLIAALNNRINTVEGKYLS
jgi:hypothetical protein